MRIIGADIFEIANQASLIIKADNNQLEIKHKFRFANKSIWGILIFLLGGIFLIVAPFIMSSDTVSKLLGVVIGFLFIAISILSLVRQVSDRLTITKTEITFKHNLKWTTIPLTRSIKVKMETEIMQISRVGTLGSDFICITHYLQDSNNEMPILKFQMDILYANNAIELGNEITRSIKDKFQKCN